MTLMHNMFTERPEVFLISYEEVIKSPYPFLLHQIVHRYREVYDDFLHLEIIEKMDMENLARYCIQRTDYNILTGLAKKEFDYDSALRELKKRFFNIYENCELLSIGNSLPMLLSQKFTQKIYLYTEEYDVRIHLDIQNSFHDMERVPYVTGNFADVLDAIPETITTFILNDVTDIGVIFAKQKEAYTNILVASYGYNYVLDEESGDLKLRYNVEEHIEENRIFKFATFIPQNLTEKHFTNL